MSENYIQKKKSVLTATEVAEELGISRTKAYDLIRSRGFPKIVMGRRVVVPRKEFENWVSAQVQYD